MIQKGNAGVPPASSSQSGQDARAPLKLPPLTDEPGCAETISSDEMFVQILDPATGTATFLVEVIDVIHNHLQSLWKKSGAAAMPSIPNSKSNIQNWSDFWNAYVPKALLPRLHAYELMMAPYAIAHMKIGLKLAETGYRFGTEERARIYLTNALEPWQKQLPLIGFDALAHEAALVNEIKRNKRFTVIIGNPPYSKISSNLTPEMRATVERYRYLDGEKIKERGALQFEINLQDDYVKFFRFCEEKISVSKVGVLGLITNNGYLSTPTLRGMRDSLLETFSSIWALDLHGHVAKGEIGPDGAQEENVFDIVQGVSVFLGDRTQPKTGNAVVLYAERYGSRAGKYSFLQSHFRTSTSFAEIAPSAPFYLFIPHDADLALEWKKYVGLAEMFPKNSAGIITARDGLVIGENKRELADRLERFSHAKGAEDAIYEEFGFSESKRFDLREAQSELRKLKSFGEPIRRMLHRPFDERFVFFNRSVVWSLSRPMADQMEDGKNLALVATRQVTRPQFEHAYVSRHIIEIKACSHDRNTQIFPLFICGSDGELALSSGEMPNLNPGILAKLAKALGLKLNNCTRQLGKDDELSPLRLFNFAYAILHCPSYRERYFEFLRSDFPRLPLTGNMDLFRALARLGGELTALHLLESPKLDKPMTKFVGSSREVVKIGWVDDTVWINAGGKKAATTAGTSGFQGVPEAVWNFHIGGYQVCEKWLKDRKGRTLTDEDIAHYHKIVISLTETIRLMSEIDQVINTHGGWPGAFASDSAVSPT
jgi:predicted helicase